LDSSGIFHTISFDRKQSQAEKKAVQLAETSIKDVNGQYEIKLAYKIDDSLMQNTKLMTLHRLKCTEKKIMKNGLDFAKIQEYFEKCYAEKVNDYEKIRERTILWCLPHLPVLNPNKPEKLRHRIVYGAAAKVGTWIFVVRVPFDWTWFADIIFWCSNAVWVRKNWICERYSRNI
jgi:hypothetical protein